MCCAGNIFERDACVNDVDSTCLRCFAGKSDLANRFGRTRSETGRRTYSDLRLGVTAASRRQVSTACGSGRVLGCETQTRPLPQAVLICP